MQAIRNRKPIQISLGWGVVSNRILLMTIGTLLGAVSVIVFFAPADIAPTGITGIAVILNRLMGTPVGSMTFILNLPVLYLAYRMLGGFKAVIWTTYVVIVYAFAVDILTPFFPTEGVSDNVLLNAIFAGVVGGFGGGLVLRGGGTFGGTGTIARIIQIKLGPPLSSTYLYANILIVLIVGATLGWESALFSLVALVVDGMSSDYVLEGPSVIRTVTIITKHPYNVSNVILYQMQRGVTAWQVTGMYTGEQRHMLLVTVSRPQVQQVQQLVAEVDPMAFIIIGNAHVAYGGGFKPVKVHKPPAQQVQTDTESNAYDLTPLDETSEVILGD